jgi:mannitol-specific phosphotransferase system IIBC component
MRLIVVFGLVMVVCTATVAYGGRKDSSFKETSALANEVAAKIVYRAGANVSATADGCRLHINFESLKASFELPLQGTAVAETDSEDGIVITNKSMTRRIKDREPEAFERLTLRFNRFNVKSILKTFEDAIAACNAKRPSVVAAN